MKPKIVLIIMMFWGLVSYAKTCDSLRVETIKGQKFIIHKAGKNETLADLVKRYKITNADLYKHNELKQNKVTENQLIKIPMVSKVDVKSIASSQLDSSKVDEAHANAQKIQKIDTHQVITGETAFLVKRNKITNADIHKHNELKQNKVTKNQPIKNPLESTADVKSIASSQPDSSKVDEAHANAQAQETQKIYTHQVVTGETVFSIAKKYKITTAQLGKWNNLRSNKIVLGQILIIDESATAKPFYKLNGIEAQMPQPVSTPKLATADLIQQTGIAFVDESMQVLHADAPIGTIIKVTNLDNGKQCLVRVTGQLDTNRFKSFIISIGNEAQEKLGSRSATIRIKLEYAIKP